MSNTRCPRCGKRWDLASRITDPNNQCHCKHRNSSVDLILEIGGQCDWITPAVGLVVDVIKNYGKVERWVDGKKVE